MDQRVVRFLEKTIGDEASPWSQDGIELANQISIPDSVFGKSENVIDYDARQLWAMWYLDSLLDTSCVSSKAPAMSYSHIYSVILKIVESGSGLPKDKNQKTSSALAKLVQARYQKSIRASRISFSRTEKLSLLDSIAEFRCWICGYLFDDKAIKKFLGESKEISKIPAFIDYLKPSGLRPVDRQIEIDHIEALAKGGRNTQNLALCCGWCNRNKSSYSSIYEQGFSMQKINHPDLGKVHTARPFWVVRLLAVRRKCEDMSGCNRTSEVTELTVALRIKSGTPNPMNLTVVCEEHDPLRNVRFVGRRFCS